MNKILLIIICFLISELGFSQKENYNWTFGNKAGLTWNKTQSFQGSTYFADNIEYVNLENIPTAFTHSMNTSEGCFTVSNHNGELLFYSNGVDIWNKENKVITSVKLTGSSSSVQSGLIFPYPGRASEYIVISLGTEDKPLLAWTAVSKNLSGNYEVLPENQNIVISPPKDHIYKEIVNGVRAANKKDYWLIVPARKTLSNNSTRDKYSLNVFKIDENGVSKEPIIQNGSNGDLLTDIGATNGSYGQIKFNKKGDKFALISHNRSLGTTVYNNLLIGSFDTLTGEIKILSQRSIGISNEQTYSVEFSPNGEYVYITSLTNTPTVLPKYLMYIFEYKELINSEIKTSELKNYGISKNITGSNEKSFFGSISRSHDDRLYITENESRNLFVITNPNNPINLNIYRLENLIPINTSAKLGLPTYASFYFNVNMNSVNICKGKETIFTINITGGDGGDNYSKTIVSLGDGSPSFVINNPTLNTSYTFSHQYPESGNYTIKMESYDLSNNIINESSNVTSATVSTCQLKVNPHIRINL